MKNITVQLNNNEYKVLKDFAKARNTNVGNAIKQVFFEKVEDEYGLNVFDKPEKHKNAADELVEEVIDDLGLNIK